MDAANGIYPNIRIPKSQSFVKFTESAEVRKSPKIGNSNRRSKSCIQRTG